MSTRQLTPARILSAVLLSSRPLSWINTAYPFAAAYLLVGGGLDARLAIGTLFFLIPYNIAMYGINDVFDYESDLRNPRKGGVEGAVLAKPLHPWILGASAVTVIPFAAYLWAVGNLASGLWLVVSLFAVVAYSAKGLRFKERPFLDSMTSSAHFVTPAIVGATLTGVALGWGFWAPMLAFFLWGMASQALGAVQDMAADREAGIGSIATVIGASRTAVAATLLYAASAVLLLFRDDVGVLAAVIPLMYAFNAGRFIGLPDAECERARAAWQVFLRLNFFAGFLLTMLFLWMRVV
ncbi:prenyltransferase [Rothia sp. AR01]|uniref:Prenyltransferase n=1 Tax=Rothia santali TaxID=2949643 RepID=A0A9X2KH85_9MICC|nr:prenyltransferase [Rothia santali]MCP3425617.1 prenyltransferase [Rothia santali]